MNYDDLVLMVRLFSGMSVDDFFQDVLSSSCFSSLNLTTSNIHVAAIKFNLFFVQDLSLLVIHLTLESNCSPHWLQDMDYQLVASKTNESQLNIQHDRSCQCKLPNTSSFIKGIVHPKMKIPSLSTYHNAYGGVGVGSSKSRLENSTWKGVIYTMF